MTGALLQRPNDGSHGDELWKSDGTEAGTVLVKDIRVGSAGSVPGPITAVGGKVCFTASDGTDSSLGQTGTELWVSDGTAAGTVLVKDIAPGISGSAPANLLAANGLLFFTTADRRRPTCGSRTGRPRARSVS